MVTIKAQFDGDRVILPTGFKARRTDQVTVSFPDDAVLQPSAQVEPVRVSVWDIIGKHTSSQTVDDITREIREDRDTWNSPDETVRGDH